jgi:ferredoxin-NADP reductase
LYFSRATKPSKLDLNQLIIANPQAVFYICGPKSLLEQALSSASAEQRKRINFESFQ